MLDFRMAQMRNFLLGEKLRRCAESVQGTLGRRLGMLLEGN